MTWAGGVRLPNREEPGDVERRLYRVTVKRGDGSTQEVVPAALADLGDGDNNHLLCLDTAAPAVSVSFPAGHLVDPNRRLEPRHARCPQSGGELMRHNTTLLASVAIGSLLLASCGGDDQPDQTQNAAARGQSLFATEHTIVDRRVDANPERNAYFGDLHVHTTYSFDAYAFGTLATPYDAYRFAKGEAIKHPAGFDMQLREPLDFYGVTDHAMFMGVAPVAADTSSDISKYPFAEVLHDLNAPDNMDRLSLLDRMRSFGLGRA